MLETIDFTTLPLDNILTITGMEKSALTFRIACGDNQYWKYSPRRGWGIFVADCPFKAA